MVIEGLLGMTDSYVILDFLVQVHFSRLRSN